MTTYTAITSGQIDAESPIDTTLAGQWTNNPIAITEGASGAPKIQAAALDADSVLQAKLKTNTGSFAGTVAAPSNNVNGSGGHVDIALNAYAFFPMVHTQRAACAMAGHLTDAASADSPRFGFYNTAYSGKAGDTSTYDVDYRYLQAT